MEVRVEHVPPCVAEHRTGHGMEHRTEEGRHAVGMHAVGTGARAHDARVTTEGGVLPCVFSDSKAVKRKLNLGPLHV